MRSLLVVGGTGFLGAELVRRATARGIDVHATHRERPIPDDIATAATWHSVDLTRPGAGEQLVRAADADTVINTAYQQNGPQVHAICCDVPGELAAATAERNHRFVHLSTDLVFDGTLGRPYSEDDEATPIMAYGQAKLDGEEAVLRRNPAAIAVRTSIIYGSPHAPQEQLVDRALGDPDFAFFTDEYRSPVHVEDLAEALLDLSVTDASGLMHLGSASRVNRHEFAGLLAAHAGHDPRGLRGRRQDPALGPRPADVSLDSTKSAGVLGRRLPGPHDRLGQSSTSDSS